MTTSTSARDIARRRLAAQLLTGPPASGPVDVVRYLGAVQSQEFAAARWSLGQRCGADDAAVRAAYDRGEILRTHVLRPTWHFVAAEDLGWMQRLTGERVRNQDRTNARRVGLDEDLVAACVAVLRAVLSGGRDLTRTELKAALATAGITLTGPQLSHLTLRAEVDSVLTSGPTRGSAPTFMLLEERVTHTRQLDDDAALAELTMRYFRSHGPAAERDFAWWSGLSITQVRRGIGSLGARLESFVLDDVTYWLDPSHPATADGGGALMISTFDEFVVAYTQTRKVAYDAQPTRSMNPNSFTQPILIDGQVVGTWRRGTGKHAHRMQLGVAAEHEPLVEAELERFARFLGVEPLEVEKVTP